jgi:hypothetical protein
MAMDRETREYLDQKYTGLAGKDDLEKLRQEAKASFRQLKEEGKTQLLEWKQEITKALEESRKQWGAEARSDLGELKAGQSQIEDQAKQLVMEVGTLNEKVGAGVVEVKEELGAMIKFSYADLERKLNALEARLQVLEKIVLQQA